MTNIQLLLFNVALIKHNNFLSEFQNFAVTWFCLRMDLDETLKKSGEHDYDSGNPSKPISDRSTINEEEYDGGCFGKGPGKKTINNTILTNSVIIY